jgi:hypothetical protein
MTKIISKNTSKSDQIREGGFLLLICLFGRLVQEIVCACWWNVVCAASQLVVLYLTYLVVRWFNQSMSPWVIMGVKGLIGYSKDMLNTWEKEHGSRGVAWVLLVIAYAYTGFVLYLLFFKTGFFCLAILLIALVKNV